MSQISLFDIADNNKNDSSTTFIDNMKLPIHRWFRYSAGFSAEWVKSVLNEHKKDNSCLLDPFAGSGTSMVAANEIGIPSIGYEKHSFVRRIANAKLHYNINYSKLDKLHKEVTKERKKKSGFCYEEQPELLKKCYAADVLSELSTYRDNFINISDDSIESELMWLAITSILRITSHVGTAQWQYVLPNKSKKATLAPITALGNKVNDIVSDLRAFNDRDVLSLGKICDQDAREKCDSVKEMFDILITSPPYPNNYDYADSTRLEMVFWNEIAGWSDLQKKIRKELIRSCSQHTAAERLILDDILAKKEIYPIIDDLTIVCRELEKVRLDHGGKKTYHTMIAAYYYDLAKVFISLRFAMKPGSLMCFVIGDSAPYGVYAPADEWLGKLALSAGFSSWEFEKTRDRNIKWKNRKHTVPLKEGRLWIRG